MRELGFANICFGLLGIVSLSLLNSGYRQQLPVDYIWV
jgi:hypothetical protein